MPSLRLSAILCVLVSLLPLSQAQTNPPATHAEIPLWPEGAPDKLGDRPEDQPTLTAYLPAPEKRNGASMLILPGGGYGHLAPQEGRGYAEWLSAQGVTCYVLKYRLGPAGYRHPAMLHDAARGLRLLRAFARRDGLDPARIGIIGSSAGGHLAATLETHFDTGDAQATDPIERESSRPDLAILCYPVISMGQYTHAGSKENLLGKTPAPELVQALSAELQVTAQTPPTFITSSVDDTVVPVENSILFAQALQQAHVPYALHIYEHGRHGAGLGTPAKPAPPWADECLYWLRSRKFMP